MAIFDNFPDGLTFKSLSCKPRERKAGDTMYTCTVEVTDESGLSWLAFGDGPTLHAALYVCWANVLEGELRLRKKPP